MKRVVYIKNSYGTNDKYILKEEYNGFGVYQEKAPSGFFIHQSWLISNNDKAELVIQSYNNLCKEELLDIIDNYNDTNKFGVKALMYCDSLHMHHSGKLV